ncbi:MULTISPECIES: ABC transporter permease [Actinomycetes]|uniref:ABC transporter permease n=1 Tax=Actinomycetes TaxID=1760 RepID=UPI0004BF0122|nr:MULTISPECIES: ABC transporter permease [Actinomycetes]
MTTLDTTPPHTTGGAPKPTPRSRSIRGKSLAHWMALDRFSGVYIIIALVALFMLWIPDTFGTPTNARALIAGQAITGVIALAATISLISGVFDLSIAATMALSISICGQLQAVVGMNPWLAVLCCLAVGAVVGVANSIIVTRLHIDPVIGTLAMSAILAAVTYWVASGQSILYGFDPSFVSLGSSEPLGVPFTLIVLIVLAAILWYVLEQTPAGRYLYAAGANPQAARLSGVRVNRLTWGALVTSGMLAAAAGVVLTMQVGSAPFQGGLPYLLPAYSAAFLGSTQIRPGRFNILGTLVAIYVVAVAVKGLQLKFPESPWVTDLVQGSILLLAVGFAVWATRRRAAGS